MSCEFVLVVDDDDDVRDSIGDVLALEGHDIVAVENGEQAIGALAVAMPRAVVTDLSMPMRSGHSLIEYLRRNDETRRIPVCVVSADPAAAPEGTVAVRKPFELTDLREALRRAGIVKSTLTAHCSLGDYCDTEPGTTFPTTRR
jgi:CheY-like chemotaxis protein